MATKEADTCFGHVCVPLGTVQSDWGMLVSHRHTEQKALTNRNAGTPAVVDFSSWGKVCRLTAMLQQGRLISGDTV